MDDSSERTAIPIMTYPPATSPIEIGAGYGKRAETRLFTPAATCFRTFSAPAYEFHS
jgi:hypothetical protein